MFTGAILGHTRRDQRAVSHAQLFFSALHFVSLCLRDLERQNFLQISSYGPLWREWRGSLLAALAHE